MLISRAVPLIFHCDVDVIIGNGVSHDVQNHLYSHTLTIVVICCKSCNLSVFHTQCSAVTFFSLNQINQIWSGWGTQQKCKNYRNILCKILSWASKIFCSVLFCSVFIVLLFLVYYYLCLVDYDKAFKILFLFPLFCSFLCLYLTSLLLFYLQIKEWLNYKTIQLIGFNVQLLMPVSCVYYYIMVDKISIWFEIVGNNVYALIKNKTNTHAWLWNMFCLNTHTCGRDENWD